MPEHPACTKTPNPLDEFGVISRFFTDRSFYPSAWPSQGAGDDCAFLDVGPMRLAVTADMMALGSHFLENASPYTVGRKALAVNLSDLAAAGSEPKAFFLSISLPRIDENWLEGFSRGLLEEARRFNCPLRGGDTVKSFAKPGQSPYTAISITAMGELPAGKGLTRAGARVGEDIWVSGPPGDAFAALGRFSVLDVCRTAPRIFPFPHGSARAACCARTRTAEYGDGLLRYFRRTYRRSEAYFGALRRVRAAVLAGFSGV